MKARKGQFRGPKTYWLPQKSYYIRLSYFKKVIIFVFLILHHTTKTKNLLQARITCVTFPWIYRTLTNSMIIIVVLITANPGGGGKGREKLTCLSETPFALNSLRPALHRLQTVGSGIGYVFAETLHSPFCIMISSLWSGKVRRLQQGIGCYFPWLSGAYAFWAP